MWTVTVDSKSGSGCCPVLITASLGVTSDRDLQTERVADALYIVFSQKDL